MSGRVGQQIGNYRLIRFLGKGGSAEVYLGEHIYLKTYAAIKVLQGRLGKESIEDFFIEARTIANLDHPHIVRVLDYTVVDDTPFLIMNYASHGSLRQRHPKGIPLLPTIILPYVKQVASALQYAHDRRLIHRDVKPANMLLNERDEVLLSDFGLVLLDQTTVSQITQTSAGTPYYMAPEQFRGKPRPASDQYALGVVVYEWLCGQLPFPTGDLGFQHTYDPPPPLREKVPAIPLAVETVVLKALAKDPDWRFASIQDFAEALERAYTLESHLLSPLNVVPTSPGVPNQPANQTEDEDEDTPTVPRVVQSSLVPLTATNTFVPGPQPKPGTSAFPLSTSDPHSEPHSATLLPQPLSVPIAFTPQTPPTYLQGLPDNTLLASSAPPTNTLLASSVPPINTLPAPSTPRAYQSQAWYKRNISRRHVMTWSIASGIVLSVGAGGTLLWELFHASPSNAHPPKTPPSTFKPPGHVATATSTPPPAPTPAEKPILTHIAKGDVKSLAWSPDGKLIASVNGAKVDVWNAATDRPLSYSPYSGHSANLKSVAWSADGKFIASGGEDVKIHVWSATTGTDLPFSPYSQHSQTVRGVAWSPDGKFIASGSEDNQARVWSATTGTDLSFSPYTNHSGRVYSVAWSPDGKLIASGSGDHKIRVWNASNGQDILGPLAHSNEVRVVAWSPDGKYIASGSLDGKVWIWDFTTGRQHTFSGHRNGVQSVAWSPDGKYIASGSLDSTVKIWDVTTGKAILTYHNHIDSVWSVAWTPDGKYIASGAVGKDHTVQIWKPF